MLWSVSDSCIDMKTRRKSTRFPNTPYEDEFECFLCGDWRPFWWYSYHNDVTLAGPDDIASVRDEMGHMWACHSCFKRSSLHACAHDTPKLFPDFHG